MAETVVIPGESEEAPTTAEVSAHEAAVAEGATAVQAELAAEAADEAKVAAEVALAAAQENAETVEGTIEATVAAQGAAEMSQAFAEEIRDAMKAQGQAITALTEELAASRRAAAAPADRSSRKRSADGEPSARKRHWYYG
jgi:fused signal recognition particle receptor